MSFSAEFDSRGAPQTRKPTSFGVGFFTLIKSKAIRLFSSSNFPSAMTPYTFI